MTRELAIVACDLTDPQLSRQNRETLFLKFFVFVRIKYFPKTTKILKNLFVFGSTKIEHVKAHFIKYNHTNELAFIEHKFVCCVWVSTMK